MLSEGEFRGFLGFDSVRSQKSWPDDVIALLRIAGESISRALARLRAEEALRKNESELKGIYDNAPLLMLLVDRERRVIKMNAQALSMARRSMEESVGLRAGQALRCVRASNDPKGCGFGSACEDCGVRNSVLTAFEFGKALRFGF